MASSTAVIDMFKNPNIKNIYRSAERVTGVFAKLLVDQSGIATAVKETEEKIRVLDQACGTGVVAVALHNLFTPAASDKKNLHLLCTDVSQPMLDATQELIDQEAWEDTETALSNILKNELESNKYDFVFASFVFMALPNSQAALDESLRVLKPGGTLAINTWKLLPWIDDANATAASLSADLPSVSMSQFSRLMGDGEWEDPDWIETQLQHRKLEVVQVKAVREMISFGTAQEMAATSALPLKLIMGRMWSDEQRLKYGNAFQSALAQHLEEKYGKDQQIIYPCEAIVTTAQKG